MVASRADFASKNSIFWLNPLTTWQSNSVNHLWLWQHSLGTALDTSVSFSLGESQ
jgi:hypothetical protein